jgi:hypothetical protein
MDPHPDPDLGLRLPWLGREPALRVRGGHGGVRSALEDDEERIAFGPDLDAARGAERVTEEGSVPLEERAVPDGTERLRQARRALDVGEQERDRPDGECARRRARRRRVRGGVSDGAAAP